MTQLEILEEIEAVDFAEEEEDIEGESANQKKTTTQRNLRDCCCWK